MSIYQKKMGQKKMGSVPTAHRKGWPPARLAVLVAGFFCCALVSGAVDVKNDIDTVLSSFPGYHLLTLEERDSDARAFIVKHFPKASASVVHADFDGDGHLDYALLLKNDKSQATKLFVLLCSEEVRCRTVYQLDVTAYSGSAYLRPVAMGSVVSQTEALDSPNPSALAKLQSTGIQITYFGKGAVVLYWNKKLRKIAEIQTED